MLTHEEITSLDEILSSHDYDSASVIAIMQDIQKTYRYLPQEALTYIAGKLKMSEAKIYGVATFYENFSLEPKGRYVIKVCDGTACHVRKSIPILEEFRNILGLSETKNHPNTDFADLRLSDDMIELLKSGRIDTALLCELAAHPDFVKLLADIQIYVEGIAATQIQNLNAWVDVARAEIMEKYQPGEHDKTAGVL